MKKKDKKADKLSQNKKIKTDNIKIKAQNIKY